MTTTIERLSPAEIGERLRIAREAANLTQAAAGAASGMARTTLVAIEQGQRKLRMGLGVSWIGRDRILIAAYGVCDFTALHGLVARVGAEKSSLPVDGRSAQTRRHFSLRRGFVLLALLCQYARQCDVWARLIGH